MVLVLGWVGIRAAFSKGLFFQLLDEQFELSRKERSRVRSLHVKGLFPPLVTLRPRECWIGYNKGQFSQTLSLPMRNATPCAGDSSAPHFQSEAIFTAKYFQLLLCTTEIKVSEENGQPRARAGGSNAFKGANTAHPTPPTLRAAGGAARSPPDAPGVGGAGRVARVGSPPAPARLGSPGGSAFRRPRDPAALRGRPALAAEAPACEKTSSLRQLGPEGRSLHREPGQGGSRSSDGSAGAVAFVRTMRLTPRDFARSLGKGGLESSDRHSELQRPLFSGSRAARRRCGRKGWGSPAQGVPPPPPPVQREGEGRELERGCPPREGGQALRGSAGWAARRASLGRGGAAAAQAPSPRPA